MRNPPLRTDEKSGAELCSALAQSRGIGVEEETSQKASLRSLRERSKICKATRRRKLGLQESGEKKGDGTRRRKN